MMDTLKLARVTVYGVLTLSIPAGCFDPISMIPDTGDTETTSSGATSTTAGTNETTAETDHVTTDVDETMTTEGPTTDGETPQEGLLGCEQPMCALWLLPECDGNCTLDETGQCAMNVLTERLFGTLEVQTCPTCARTILALRGFGTPDVLVQDVTFADGEPVSFGPITRCQLADPTTFAACKEMPTAECLLLANWMTDCIDVEELTCPKEP